MNNMLKPLLSALLFVCFSITTLIAKHPHENADEKHDLRYLYFIENKGQWSNNILYKAKLNAARLFVEKDRLTYHLMHPTDLSDFHHAHHHPHENTDDWVFRGHALQMIFNNTADATIQTGNCPSAAYHNYFMSKDSSKWTAFVPQYREVAFQNMYNGINLRLYSYEKAIKYDFIVAPNTNTEKINFSYEGVDSVFIDNQGNLHAVTSVNTIIDSAPYAYQYVNQQEVAVACNFIMQTDGSIGFAFPDGYDQSRELIIDPSIVFSTFSGSFGDNWGMTATYDQAGHLYAGSSVFEPGYPTTLGAYQTNYSGGGTFFDFSTDIGIAKFAPDGATLIYSTHIGENEGSEFPQSLFVDPRNNELLILGSTSSNTFPTTSNAFDDSFAGGTAAQVSSIEFENGTDIVVVRLSGNGSNLIGSTFLGGSGNDGLNLDNNLAANYSDEARGEIIVDNTGHVYIASSTRSSNFPVTAGAFQSSLSGTQDACIAKLSPDLSNLVWSTYFGGNQADAAYSLKLDGSGNVIFCGGTRSANLPMTSSSYDPTYAGGQSDGYIAKLNGNGNALLSATYLGTNAYDQCYFIDIDDENFIYTTGQTSGNYLITPGVYSNPNSGQFIHKLDNNLSSTEFSTVFGNGNGGPNISPTAFLVDICKRVYVSGWGGVLNADISTSTTSGLPITGDAFQTSSPDNHDFYFITLSENAASLEYATYFGGFSGEHVDGGTSRFDKKGFVYQAVCAGCGGVNGFPTTTGAWSNTNNSDNCNMGAIKFDFEPPIVVAEAAAEPDFFGCAPLTVNFVNSSLNATDYFWDFNDNGATSIQENPIYTYTQTGFYQVMLVADDPDACNLSDTTFVSVQVVNPLTFNADFTSEVDCETLSASFTPSLTGPVSYQWSFGDGNFSTQTTPTHTYDAPGFYSITLTTNSTLSNCPATATAVQTIEIKDVVEAGVTADDLFGCIPFEANFIQNSFNASSFEWDLGDGNIINDQNTVSATYPDPGIYTVTLTAFNPESCNLESTTTFSVEALDTIIASNFTFVLPGECDPPTVQFNTNYGQFTSYEWIFDDVGSSTEANPLYTFNDYGEHTISLIVSTPCAPPDTSVQTLFMPFPNIVTGEIVATPDNGCVPHTISLEAIGNAIEYQWDMGDGTTLNGQSVSYVYDAPGLYNIVLEAIDESTCNQVATDTTTVEGFVNAIADFDSSLPNALAEIGQVIFFTNNSQFADSYLWDFGDGNTSTEENPNYVYETVGEYQVCLTASNPQNCPDIYCENIVVIPPIFIGVPNAFTPNNDNLNDILFVEGNSGIEFMELKIFNRWGEMVFITNNPEEGWNGVYKNQAQEMEVYAFTLVANLISGRQISQEGNITLIR